ncbi:hypothetical protein EI94DRAFT_1744153 [Lactarius quietus]|nr:hypothetical protein EI94DRAFT_1744153 [Lactarius quietus]
MIMPFLAPIRRTWDRYRRIQRDEPEFFLSPVQAHRDCKLGKSRLAWLLRALRKGLILWDSPVGATKHILGSPELLQRDKELLPPITNTRSRGERKALMMRHHLFLSCLRPGLIVHGQKSSALRTGLGRHSTFSELQNAPRNTTFRGTWIDGTDSEFIILPRRWSIRIVWIYTSLRLASSLVLL